jgi:hypothetical protein
VRRFVEHPLAFGIARIAVADSVANLDILAAVGESVRNCIEWDSQIPVDVVCE